MKFVIFADKSYNYIKPVAIGLEKMLNEAGHETFLYNDGLFWLQKINPLKLLITDIYKLIQNIRHNNKNLFIYRFWNVITFYNKKRRKEISNCDCIIIVYNCPSVFYKTNIKRTEWLRKKFNKPIVNYDLHYLPNQGWYKRIKESNPTNFGLERFDWYLTGSVVTEFALPKDIPQIYSLIGFDLRFNNLYPEQKDFIALLDFPRNGYEKERELQIKALKETNTQFIELKGRYTTEEIRSIYRKTSLYFISFRESFGLPIIELQLCGSLIFTPYKEWLPAHFLNKNIYDKGNGNLGSNFVIYNQDINILKNNIYAAKSQFNANANILNFKHEYPFYYSGNINELKRFCNKISNGEINSSNHRRFEQYNQFISLTDDIILYE